MRLSRIVVCGLLVGGGLAGCTSISPTQPLRVAVGFTSHLICSETFVSGLDPDQVYRERVEPTGAMRWLDPLLSYQVDRSQRTVSATLAGGIVARAAFHEGLGCVVLSPDSPDRLGLVQLPAAPPPGPPQPLVTTSDVALEAALARAFSEPASPPYHRTTAVVVLRDGRIIAERYAPGYGPDTRLLGFSMSKSLTVTLVGILVRQGKLSVTARAPLSVWTQASDARHDITLDQLLRQTSGIDVTQNNSGFDRNSRIEFIDTDKGQAAQSVGLTHPPGSHWAYTDANYLLISRIVRDAVGGQADDVVAFARRELFEPLGMRDPIIEFDETGTPIGSSFSFATARDWARLGQLYLDDGVVASQRILPAGWVEYVSTPTLETGYGAGFWVNRRPGLVPGWGAPWGLPDAPPDTFFARGFMGQYVIVIPSRHLVITRLGVSHVFGDDAAGANQLVKDVLGALASSGGSPKLP